MGGLVPSSWHQSVVLSALQQRVALLVGDLLEASQKDLGFDRNLLAAQLGRFDRLPAASFRLPAKDVERLRNKVQSWQDQLRLPPA